MAPMDALLIITGSADVGPEFGCEMVSFEEALSEVWRQTLVEDAKSVALGQERYPVRRTPKRHLRQVVVDHLNPYFFERSPEI